MENKQMTNCNQCPNQCPADALQCGRGRHYFEQMGNAEAAKSHDRGNNYHDDSHGRGHGKPDDLYGLMRMCGHYLHNNGGGTQLFDGLEEAEQESLKKLLKKLTDSWEKTEE